MLFRVLGPLEVEIDTERITLSGLRLRALLTALLTQPNTVVPAHRLAQAVWGDEHSWLAESLEADLRFADGFFDERMKPLFEKYAQRAGLDLPPDDRVPFDYTVPEVTELDLAAEGIGSVVWTTGYTPDYAWLDVPVIGELGVPRHVRGVTDVPGLTFLGLLFQLDNASANLTGVARDAEYLASRWTV